MYVLYISILSQIHFQLQPHFRNFYRIFEYALCVSILHAFPFSPCPVLFFFFPCVWSSSGLPYTSDQFCPPVPLLHLGPWGGLFSPSVQIVMYALNGQIFLLYIHH
eukprot:TRINITY_DN13617_c0_g1::TRINITY_DN13617_c0_g1_i1::g.22224::m.22224 TRINITY_DN13617_c0_g1::TRINITY_DN13617_c0_g1_i1::g.22224  ORF type:complete len:106 (+),score=1.30 TRINITY_DN13617_c0_g1_i1:82-399(+)